MRAVALLLLLAAAPTVLFDAPSEFNGRVIVTEDNGVRTMRFSVDGAVQSEIRVGAPHQLLVPYTRAAMLGLALVPQPKRILIIGLGGGTMAMFLKGKFPKAQIDGVDIDPVVLSVAKKHFGLVVDERLRAIVADGRKFTESATAGYDLVFLDAYDGEDPPEHLMTVEFLSAVRGKLAPHGAVVGNVWGPDENARYGDVVRTWESAFDAVCVLPVADTGNSIFLARADGHPVGSLNVLPLKRALGFDLQPYVRSGCRPLPKSGEVIRDQR